MSSIPPSIRKILDSGRGEIRQLEREYHLWLILTFLAFSTSFILFCLILILSISGLNGNLLLVKIFVSLSAIINLVIGYFLLQETLERRQYLQEVQKLMLQGLSVIDGIRKSFRELFGER
ncbi:MAG: hypothetical protein EAX86_13515 [Candidatus Heimdallarchaeota archaeon]|nr:hypothetical protein [Candidatus Heimdallarchaeota archaeon]